MEVFNFLARNLKRGQKWTGNTGENEYLFVLLDGNFSQKHLPEHGKHGTGEKMYSEDCLTPYICLPILSMKYLLPEKFLI